MGTAAGERGVIGGSVKQDVMLGDGPGDARGAKVGVVGMVLEDGIGRVTPSTVA